MNAKPVDKHSEWLQQIKASRGEAPLETPEVQTKPYTDLIWAWNAFWRLSNKRPQGFNGPLRIPDSEILAHIRLFGWDRVKAQDFCHFCDRLDEAFMAHVAKLQKAEEAKRERESGNRDNIPRRKR